MHAINLHDFFYMGGYARYVWSAYGLCAIVLLGNSIVPWRQAKNVTRP